MTPTCMRSDSGLGDLEPKAIVPLPKEATKRHQTDPAPAPSASCIVLQSVVLMTFTDAQKWEELPEGVVERKRGKSYRKVWLNAKVGRATGRCG
jgi:hypothetical protein